MWVVTTVFGSAWQTLRTSRCTCSMLDQLTVHLIVEPYADGMPDPTVFKFGGQEFRMNIKSREEIDLEWGGKLVFMNSVVGGAIDTRFMPAILKGIMERMERGPLTGSYARDVRVIVYDGKMHPVDSNELSFMLAARNAFAAAFKEAGPKILEPIYDLEVYVPADIIHYKGESTHKTSFEYVHVFYNAMLIFMRKHYSHLSRLVILPLQVAVYFIAMLTLVSAMWSMMKKSLGFARRYDKEFPMLILEGSDKMKQRCRAIAMRKGLNLIDDIRQAGQQVVIRVFDPSETPYADIIRMMQQTANERVRLGLYHSDSDIIITQMEIYE